MFKLVAAAIAGAVSASAVFAFLLLPAYRDNYLAVGATNGAIDARGQLATRLKSEFSPSPSCSIQSVLFDVKSTSVYVVTCDGGKSILVEDQ
jgi:hypothetical protein